MTRQERFRYRLKLKEKHGGLPALHSKGIIAETKKTNTRGRPRGAPNKLPGLLKDALIEAADLAGTRVPRKFRTARGALVDYLAFQAQHSPAAFMSLLGKVLPLQINNAAGPLIQIESIQMVVVDGRTDEFDGPRDGDEEVLTSIEGAAEVLALDGPDSEVSGSIRGTRGSEEPPLRREADSPSDLQVQQDGSGPPVGVPKRNPKNLVPISKVIARR